MSKPYYEDEFVTLFHGDCLEVTEWLDADVLVTDPPYGENRSLDRANVTKVTNDHNTETRDSALALWSNQKPAIIFGTWKCERPKNIKHLVVWDKVSMSLGDQTAAFATSHEETQQAFNFEELADA